MTFPSTWRSTCKQKHEADVSVTRVWRVLVIAICSNIPLITAVAHEGAKMECNETNINAMNTDVQAMRDGNAKTKAAAEMKMAKEKMAIKDTKACETHMHNAMEATEE
jgi:hypothetical protein